MEKFGAVDPKITPDVEAPATQCTRPDCACRGADAVKSANFVQTTIARLDADFRRKVADAAKTKLINE